MLCTQAMKDRKSFLAAHYGVGFRTAVRFRLLDEIENHQDSKPCVWSEHEDLIKELAVGISNQAFTQYNLNEEYIQDKFGIKDVSTALLLCEIAFYQAGCEAKVKHSHPSMEYLEEIEENMDGGFFDGYLLQKDVLAQIVEDLKGKALDIADQSRGDERNSGALRKFCEKLDTETTEDGIIGRINYMNDGAYIEIAPAVRALSWLLKVAGYWEEYNRLLGVLKYFPLQGSLIRGLRNTEDVVAVIKTAVAHNGRKSLHYLLREQCFTVLSEEGDLLSSNLKDQFLLDKDKDYIKSLLEDFEKNKPGHVKDMVGVWLNVFGIEELTSWLAGKKAEAERKHEKYGKPELDIVNMMMDAYSLTSADIFGFDLEGKNFEVLITLAAKAKNKDVCAKIVKALQKNIFSEHSYPPTTLNELWFEQVRTIYRCLNISGLDGLEMLKEELRPLEGYRVNLGDAMRNVRQEGYWLAMLLMSLEENGDETRFTQYVNVLFRDSRNTLGSLSDDMFTPYYVAELLVSQVMTGIKDEFEKRVIEEIPHLVFVIRVLTGNDGVMSVEIKQLLKDRIANEWETERMLLSQRKTGNLKFFDEYVNGIMK